MTYNLATELDRQRAETRFHSLLARGAVITLTEKVQRSINQNSYLHLIIAAVAMEVGVPLDYAKEVYYKRLANGALFVRSNDDPLAGKVETLRSSTELSKEEMSASIDRFKVWAAENGMYLPEPGDKELLREIEIQMAKLYPYL